MTGTGSFVAELKRIAKNKRRATEILSSTDSYYAELKKQLVSAVSDLNSNLTVADIPVHAELSTNDKEVLLRRFVSPVILVVGGSRCSCVALLLRRLLGRPLFSDNGETCLELSNGKPCQIRDVRIQYGPSHRVTFSNGQSVRLSGNASTIPSHPLVDSSILHSSSAAGSSVPWSSWYSSELSLEIELTGVQLLRSISILVTKQNTLSGVMDYASKLLTTSQPIVLFRGTESSSPGFAQHLSKSIPAVVVSSYLPTPTLASRTSEKESALSSSTSGVRISISKKGSGKRRSKATKYTEANDDNCCAFSILELDKATSHLMSALQSGIIESVACLATNHERVLTELIDWSYAISRDSQLTASRLAFAKDKCQEMHKLLRGVAEKDVPSIVSHCLNKIRDQVQRYLARKFEAPSVTSTTIESKPAMSGEFILQELALDIESRLAFEAANVYSSFIETLFRCLSTLEGSSGSQGAVAALDEMTRISQHLNIPVEVGSSGIKKLAVRFRRLMAGKDSEVNDVELQLVLDSLSAISDSKLSSHITSELLSRLEKAYEMFVCSINQLITAHDSRINRLYSFRCRIKRHIAPKVASLYLESISLRDLIAFGRPAVGRELGRGQYGIVYSCEKWGPYRRLAVKSVVPADEHHWGELALELFHARHLPEHPNLLTLRGSLIGYSNFDDVDNRLTAVLVVTDRMTCDLNVAMQRGGLSLASRLAISVDICVALRFLHNRGLIHRDVKLKNILLDSRNRARLADLGFCQPAALIAGSVVGTPIHMAPELLDSHFHSPSRVKPVSILHSARQFGALPSPESPDLLAAIDIYAFGILFWYVCSNQTRMPKVFRTCESRDALWTAVRRGSRPERLPLFSETMWELMETCWDADPAKRPHIGRVIMTLEDMLNDLAAQPGHEMSFSESLDFGEYNAISKGT